MELSMLLSKIEKSGKDVLATVQSYEQDLTGDSSLGGKGISFLDTKNQCLLQYLMDLSMVVLRKTSGEKLSGSAVVERLVENRVVLEKMRPIDRKLQYQVDKCVRVANTGTLSSNDPLSFKPNPLGMRSKLDEEDVDDEAEGERMEKKSKVGLYQPPRLAAVHYDQESESVRKEEALKKSRARAMNSSVMRDLKEQHSEEPVEIRSGTLSRRLAKEDEERKNYEEDYHVRLTSSKKKKTNSRTQGTMSELNAMTNFGAMSAITGSGDGEKGKKRKRKGGKGGPGKKGKKRKF